LKFFTIVKDYSERLPGKNFLDLEGTPLWRHTVNRFSSHEVFVNTDSGRLLSADDSTIPDSVKIYKRSQEHVDWEAESDRRGSPVNAMLGEFFEKYVDEDDEPVVLFHVTSPFVRLETILDASRHLGAYSSVHSVQRIRDFAWLEGGGDHYPVNFSEDIVARTQDLPSLLLSRGAFFILTKEAFSRNSSRDARPRYFYELSPVESIEIDTSGDFALAQAVAKGTRP